MKHQDYVLGFTFCSTWPVNIDEPKFKPEWFTLEQRPLVLLLEKQRPEYQAGLLNGLGGKVEDVDNCHEAAMAREMWEEAGVSIPSWAWHKFCQLKGQGRPINNLTDATFTVHCYWTLAQARFDPTTHGDEPVAWYDARMITIGDGPATMPNLRWLVPMALNSVQTMLRRIDAAKRGSNERVLPRIDSADTFVVTEAFTAFPR